MKKRGYLSVLGLAVTLSAIVSCGGNNGDIKYDLVYRSWDYGTKTQNNAERQLVKAFEEKYNVHVKIVENPGTGNGYFDGIKASVYNKVDVADVYMLPTIPGSLELGYLYNIKDLANADPEFSKIPNSVKEACNFNGGIYAVPARLNMQGYFANTSLIESWGINTDDLSVESEFEAVRQIIEEGYNHISDKEIGIDTTAHWIDTQASVNDTTGKLGYFTWDGEKYNLHEKAFIDGIKEAKSYYQSKKTLDSYTVEEKESVFNIAQEEDPKTYMWNNGKLALRYGATYEMADMITNKETENNYRFIGNPGGKVPIVGDYYGIYKETKNPQLAYDFAKWMSFGSEGFAKRVELYNKPESGTINTLPLTTDQQVIDNYFETYSSASTIEGVEEAYEYIGENSMVEGVKVIGAYLKSRQTVMTGQRIVKNDGTVVENANMFELLDACVTGSSDITSFAKEGQPDEGINKLANDAYQAWMKNNGAN